jgi:hypothetical protein
MSQVRQEPVITVIFDSFLLFFGAPPGDTPAVAG